MSFWRHQALINSKSKAIKIKKSCAFLYLAFLLCFLPLFFSSCEDLHTLSNKEKMGNNYLMKIQYSFIKDINFSYATYENGSIEGVMHKVFLDDGMKEKIFNVLKEAKEINEMPKCMNPEGATFIIDITYANDKKQTYKMRTCYALKQMDSKVILYSEELYHIFVKISKLT